MTYLVTGSSGFIGTALCDHLRSHGEDVVGVDQRPSPTTDILADITSDSFVDSLVSKLSSASITHLIHLAARTDLHGQSLSSYEANTIGVLNVCSLVKRLSIQRSIFTSSQLVNSLGTPFASYSSYNPDTTYGISKVASELIVQSALSDSSFEYLIVRPTTVWGPGCSAHYQNFLSLLSKGMYIHPTLEPVFKSFSFIGNAVHQLYSISTTTRFPNRCTDYLCDYEPIEIYDWSSRLSLALGKKPPIRIPANISLALTSLTGLMSASQLIRRNPFTSRRVRNITTEYVYRSPIVSECVPGLPFSFDDGIHLTSRWYLQNLSK